MPRGYGTGKKDANQNYIVRRLADLPGVSVKSLAEFSGQLDLLVGYAGRTYWYELKCPGAKADLTEREARLIRGWAGHVNVVEFFSEIIRDIGYPLDAGILRLADELEKERYGV